jgi:hypothetical protein
MRTVAFVAVGLLMSCVGFAAEKPELALQRSLRGEFRSKLKSAGLSHAAKISKPSAGSSMTVTVKKQSKVASVYQALTGERPSRISKGQLLPFAFRRGARTSLVQIGTKKAFRNDFESSDD